MKKGPWKKWSVFCTTFITLCHSYIWLISNHNRFFHKIPKSKFALENTFLQTVFERAIEYFVFLPILFPRLGAIQMNHFMSNNFLEILEAWRQYEWAVTFFKGLSRLDYLTMNLQFWLKSRQDLAILMRLS